MRELADKAETERCLARCREAGVAGLGPGAGSFFPRTWLLPEARDELFEHVKKRRASAQRRGAAPPTVIFKPAAGSEGNGIVLIQHESRLPSASGYLAAKPAVAQTYVSPLLYDGVKFDLRLYALVRSVDPLEVYLHREGLARFCTEPYAPPTADNLHRAYAHLTNYSLNKRSDAYVNATDVAAAADREAFAGASKRPASYVIQELDAKGLIDAPTVWAQIERLSALVAFAFQPELALRYRSTFPAAAKETLGAAAAPRDDDGEPGDDARRAFHVLGLDVMLDKRGVPRLIEVNSNPSLAIDQEVEVDGETVKEESPVDLYVKTRVLSDMMVLVAEGARDPALRAIVGGGAPAPPRDLTLLDRCRRLYAAALLKPEKGMGSGQWVRFCRDAGLLGLPGNILKADLEIMHAKLCAQQLWSPDQPAQKLMRHSTFARALVALAAKAFPDEPSPADKLESLLSHIARADEGE